jgi:hypothetical protein
MEEDLEAGRSSDLHFTSARVKPSREENLAGSVRLK